MGPFKMPGWIHHGGCVVKGNCGAGCSENEQRMKTTQTIATQRGVTRRVSRHHPLRLTVNDLLFVNEYLANGRNGTKAYQTVHPRATYSTANSKAPLVAAKASVQAEMARRITAERGITKEMIVSDLMTARDIAIQDRDGKLLADVSMDCAKLAGLLVEQRRELPPDSSDLTEQQIWDELETRMKAREMSDKNSSANDISDAEPSTEG